MLQYFLTNNDAREHIMFIAQELPEFDEKVNLQALLNFNNNRPWPIKNSSVAHRLRVLSSESSSDMCAKLRTMAASNNRDHLTRSLYCCLFMPYIYGVFLHAHLVRGESHIYRNTTRQVAKTSPPLYNQPHRLHILCVKAASGTTFTSWSQHHFVAVRKLKRHVHKASHCGSKQQ